jgi:alpha-amylase
MFLGNRFRVTRAAIGVVVLFTLVCPRVAVADESAVDGRGSRWWDGAVFYEIFVRSFADSTVGPLANDGIGDLRGLIERLDYLNDGDPETYDDLGVTGIWLMPIMQSTSYHGYDTTDYYAVEDDYGTNEDFRELIEQAHARGIRVIVDLVLNHSSSKHPWFIDAQKPGSEYRDWYTWSDKDPGYKGPWGQKVWHEAEGGQWYYGAFSPGMPDLNFRNPAVTREMLKATRFWLEEMNADGFRLDAIKHLIEVGEKQEHTRLTHEWLRGFYSFYKRVNPEALAVGEVWTDSQTVAKYVGGEMDLAFEFDQAYATIHAANTGEKDRLAKAQAASWELFPGAQFATFLANHDMDRVMSQFGGDVGKAKLAATIQLTSPGVPFIYYGEEIGMGGGGGDPNVRGPMQWTGDEFVGFSTVKPWYKIGEKRDRVNVASQDGEEDSLLNLYRKLIRLRAEHPALGRGGFTPIETDHPQVYAYLRRGGGEEVLVVVNLGGESIDGYALLMDGRRFVRGRRVEELLHGAEVAVPDRAVGSGGSGYQPIGVLEARTGYVLVLPRVER